MGPPAVPYPRYLITLIGPNSGAGDGEPGAAVRDTTTGRVIDRIPGRMDVYSAVTGTGIPFSAAYAIMSARPLNGQSG